MKDDIIRKIISVQPDDTFLKRKSNLQYFIQNDICESLLRDVTVSLFRYYRCNVVCKNCFAKKEVTEINKIETYNNYDKFIKDVKILSNYVSIIDTADDIELIKLENPSLLDILEEISSICYYSNNIKKIEQIIKNKWIYKFKGIYDISCFSSQLDSNTCTVILSLLSQEHSRVKIILDETNAHSYDSIQKIYEKYPDKIVLSQCFSSVNEFYTSEVSMSTNLALMLDEFTYGIRYNKNNPTIFTIDDIMIGNDIDIVKTVFLICYSKIKRYFNGIVYANNHNLNELDEINYMRWVVNNINVNPNYNFIIKNVLEHNSKLNTWFDKNWQAANGYGYFNPHTYNKKIIPLFGVKDDNS